MNPDAQTFTMVAALPMLSCGVFALLCWICSRGRRD